MDKFQKGLQARPMSTQGEHSEPRDHRNDSNNQSDNAMKKRIILITLLSLCVATLFAQTVSVTFTGRDAQNHYLPLNRVVVSNLTKGWQETLTWPDTVLVMTSTGIGDAETQNFASLQLSQNNPNPFDGTTYVNLNVTDLGDVELVVTDITGRIVGANNYSPLQPGVHEIRVTLSSSGLYFLTARQNGKTASVKMVNRGNGGGNVIAFVGVVETLRATSLPKPKISHRGTTDNPFAPGDQIEYVGFAMQNGTEVESGHVVQTQETSQTVVLTFGNGAPCPGIPTVTDYDGNVYNTVQIGQQCWMRENLRTTHYADGTVFPAGGDNVSHTNPYYYDYSGSSIPLNLRGYYYNWSAAMQGAAASNAVPSGVQGVCPNGWHLPSDAEWTMLTDYVSLQSEYTCGGETNYIAKSLASTEGWNSCSGECLPGDQSAHANNASGYAAVPAGYCDGASSFSAGIGNGFWSTTENGPDGAWYRGLLYDGAYAGRHYGSRGYGFSVRCLRDE